MKIFVINLDTSKQRLDFQQLQFERLNLKFERIPAVSINDISEQEYQALGFGWQRPLRKVEVACFLSHKKAWEAVLSSNEPTLILEDDAVLVNDLAKVLDQLDQKQLNDIDLINFEVRSRKKIISKKPVLELLDLDVEFYDLYQDRTGAAGYLLYPSGAQKLLSRLEATSPAIADGFIFSAYELNALQIEPALIIQEDQLAVYGLSEAEQFESTIGRSENFKPTYKSLSEKKMFRKRRVMGQLKMAFRYLQVLFKAEKRFILLDKERFR